MLSQRRVRDFTHHCSGKVPDLKSVHPLGSVILITDAAGAKAREMAYRPYGEVLYASAILPAVSPEATLHVFLYKDERAFSVARHSSYLAAPDSGRPASIQRSISVI